MKSSSSAPNEHPDNRSLYLQQTDLRERAERIGLPPGEDLPKVSSNFERQCHTRFRVRTYTDENLEEVETDDPEEVKEISETQENVWIHVEGVHAADKLRRFGELLDLHPLTIEDVMNVWARPRVEINKKELFFTLRAVQLEPDSHQLKGQQISIVFRENLVISFAENEEDVFSPVVSRLRVKESRLRKQGAYFLAYSLIDTLVDRLLMLTESIEERIVEMEEEMLGDDDNNTVPIHEIYRRKRQILRLNRVAFPLRDAVHDFHDLSPEVMDSSMDVYIRDLLDHSRRAADRVEHARRMLYNLQDFHSSRQDNRINRNMRLLTVIGTIFIPLTFVAGIYGMNFDPKASPWNMPLLDSYWGYPICLGGMLTFAIVMVIYFHRKGWL
ncbi:MAG: magnesium/cobalt transporter CorA [Verrucomicrobiota bacterium]